MENKDESKFDKVNGTVSENEMGGYDDKIE